MLIKRVHFVNRSINIAHDWRLPVGVVLTNRVYEVDLLN